MFRNKKVCPVCQQPSLVIDPDNGTISCTHCTIYTTKASFFDVLYAWVLRRNGWIRLPLYAWFWYTVQRYVTSNDYPMQRIANAISAIDLGMHELGHYLFIPFGTFMTIAGGSIMQVLFPLVWVGIALWKRWYFAAGLCLCWTGLSLIDVSIYAADAQVRLLPLVTLNNDYDSAHDWYQMLTRLDVLVQTDQIAHVIRMSGIVAIGIGMAWSGALILVMCFASVRRWLNPSSKTTVQ